MLQQKRVVEEAVWSNPQMEQFLTDGDNPGLAVTLHDLVKTFQQVLERRKEVSRIDLQHEQFTVAQMMAQFVTREIVRPGIGHRDQVLFD